MVAAAGALNFRFCLARVLPIFPNRRGGHPSWGEGQSLGIFFSSVDDLSAPPTGDVGPDHCVWASGTQCWGLCQERAREMCGGDGGEGASGQAGTCLGPKEPGRQLTALYPPSKTHCREGGEGAGSSLLLNTTTCSRACAVGLHHLWVPHLQIHLLTQLYFNPQTNTQHFHTSSWTHAQW